MSDIGERKLATIRRIANIEPIPGADRIVKATIDGWELVTQKDNYAVGDLCVYFEIDSFLPVREEFEFLRKACFKSTTNLGDGFRIKTIKLKGQVSQGLSLPLKDFFQEDPDGRFFFLTEDGHTYLEEGTDVTAYLGVQKYEKPIPANLAGRIRGNFPSFIPKTDQERVQNCFGFITKWIAGDRYETEPVTETELVRYLNDCDTGLVVDTDTGVNYFKSSDLWFKKVPVPNDPETVAARRVFEATLKLDGSSMTVYHNEGQVGVCSRNLDLKRDPENAFWRAAIQSRVLGALVQVGRNVAVQGELMGPGVQGNRENLPCLKLFVFDVYDIDARAYMTPTDRSSFLDDLWEFIDNYEAAPHFGEVPVVDESFVVGPTTTVQTLLETASATRSINHEVGEGIVFKSHESGGPSFKVISNRFLLAEKD